MSLLGDLCSKVGNPYLTFTSLKYLHTRADSVLPVVLFRYSRQAVTKVIDFVI